MPRPAGYRGLARRPASDVEARKLGHGSSHADDVGRLAGPDAADLAGVVGPEKSAGDTGQIYISEVEYR